MDEKYLRLTIENSKKSADKKLFPAGAVLLCGGGIVSSTISSIWPRANHHADSDAIDQAMDKLNRQLSDCTLYTSMEPCLMCISRAYWAGVRRIVFAAKKEDVSKEYFEGSNDNISIIERFNEKIEMIHFDGLEKEALEIVREWEKRGGFNQ